MRRLEACSLALLGFFLLALLTICLVFFTLPFSFQTVECTHRSLCHRDVPFIHVGILNVQNGYHLRRQVPPHVVRGEGWKGCWKESDGIMILTDGFMYVLLGHISYIYIQAKRVQQPQPGKRRHPNFVFRTTSLNFLFELLKIRYDPRNSLNWSDHLTPFEIYILGISSSKSRHSRNGKWLIFVTCWH